MGIFDFIKNAGAKIFKGEDDKGGADSYKPLREHVTDHGIDASGLNFRFDAGVLIVEGTVPSQELREKVILIVGNVDGVGQVDDRLHVGAAAPAGSIPLALGRAAGAIGAATGAATGSAPDWTSRTYTVKKGDTLSAIAKQMYGSANKYTQIFEANKPMLKHPDKIYPGQMLRIPPE